MSRCMRWGSSRPHRVRRGSPFHRMLGGESGRYRRDPGHDPRPGPALRDASSSPRGPAGAHRESHRRPAAARTRRRDGGGLLRGFLSALGPIGGHPLGHRILLFGRHRTALPRRLGVGRGLRDRGGRSRRPPRRGAPSHGLRRRGGGPEDLVDVVNALISACRRSISLCRSAIASAITFIGFPGAVSSVARCARRGRARPWVWILTQRGGGVETEPAHPRRSALGWLCRP